MSLAELIGFLLLAGVAAYAQTLTGFAFGLITMGGVGLMGMMSLSDAALIVSVLTVVNAVQMFLKGWRDIARREFWLVMATSLPLLVVGYWILDWLSGDRADLLRLILGFSIIVSSLQLASKPAPLARPSGRLSFLFFGGIAGLLGGMFSTAGPPLVYHFYRQPMQMVKVRETLVTIFAVSSVFRIGIVALAGHLPSGSAWSAFLAIPAVMGATYAARRWPPPLSPATMRHIVVALLFLSGVSLGAPAVIHLMGA